MKAARILPILIVLAACANHKSEAKPAAPPPSGASLPGGSGGPGGPGAKDGAKAEPPAKVDPGKTEGSADLPGIDITGA